LENYDISQEMHRALKLHYTAAFLCKKVVQYSLVETSIAIKSSKKKKKIQSNVDSILV